MKNTLRKRMKREQGGWLNLNNTFISNKQRKKFEEINKRIEKHNKQNEKIINTLNNSQFGDGSSLDEVRYYDYKIAKSKATVKSLQQSMVKFNRTLDKYGSYKQKYFMDNFKKSLADGDSPKGELNRVLSKINQLEPVEFDMLSRVNAEFTITYRYYDDNSSLANLEQTLDDYLSSDTRKQVMKIVRQTKI